MATWDLRLKLGLAGFLLSVLLFIVAALGEFVFHWWDDLGLWLAIASILLAIAFGFYTSSRFQVRELGEGIRGVTEGVRVVGRGVERLEASSAHIEANTEAIPGIKADTAETVALLRDIRDRLPAPGR